MSKTIYISIIFLFILGIIVCIYQAGRKKSAIARMIFKFEIAVLLVVLSNSFFIMTYNIDVAYIAKGMSFGLCDLMIVYMLEYTIEYTGNIKRNKYVHHFYYLYAIVDMILIIAFNLNGRKVFELKLVSDGGENAVYAISKLHPLFLLHVVFFYLLSAFIIISFTYSLFNVSRFYKKKYRLIYYIFILTIVVSILNINRAKLMPGAYFIDISIIVYSILAIFVCYFTLYYVPRGMIGKSLSIINKSMKNGIVSFDLDGRCIYINENARRLYNKSFNPNDDTIETKFSEWLKDRDISKIKNQKWDEEVYINGEKRYLEKTFNKLYDDNDFCVGCYFMIYDKTEELAAYEKEIYITSHDVLTGLYNRETFFLKVSEFLKNNDDKKYAMICTDIREFKLVNDLFGIEKGNEVICKEAGILKKIAGESGVCGRLGADKFAICVERGRYTEDTFTEAVAQIRKLFPNNIYKVHIYMGVYYIEDIDEMPNLMCDKANFAIGTIKGDYQKFVAYYDETLLEKTIEEKRMVGEFDQAIENHEFVIFLQPQTDSNGNVIGSEALVRWIHPKYGLLNPGAFIETFEKTGLIYRLDLFVWNEAVKQLKNWKDEGITDMHISVNISAKDFFYIDIYRVFTELVEKYGIDPDKLKLEITETAIMTDIKKNLKIIKRLQEYGFDIEIDDFGSGYSSLNTLKDICADVVKIDMGFLRKTENEERSNVILKNMISMSGELDMSVITEGVETREQVDKLKDMGCKMFQGYYFAKPMPVSEFEEKYLNKDV